MYINYSLKKYPIVHVCVNDNQDLENIGYKKFMDFWESQYKKEKKFIFFINLENLNKPNVSLLLDFTKRMRIMKNQSIQYLNYSIIVIKSNIIINLLKQIWKIVPPLNTIYIVPSIETGELLLKNLYNTQYDENYINTFLFIHKISKVT